jgi:outer membrane protein W
MKNTIVTAIFLTVVACIVLRESDLSYAEEVYKNFSLGYGNLNPVAADAKAPSPSVVTAKYGFSLAKDFWTYVGSGLAYTISLEGKPAIPGDTSLRIKKGVAGEAGFKFLLGGNSSLSLDYKFLYLEPGALHGDGYSAPPQSLGVGLDIKF